MSAVEKLTPAPTWRVGGSPQQLRQRRRRLDAELLVEEQTVGAVAAQRGAPVALRQVGPNQQRASALAQWVRLHRPQRSIDRRPDASGLQPRLAQELQRVQPQLAEPLPVEGEPVLVPVGEEVV